MIRLFLLFSLLLSSLQVSSSIPRGSPCAQSSAYPLSYQGQDLVQSVSRMDASYRRQSDQRGGIGPKGVYPGKPDKGYPNPPRGFHGWASYELCEAILGGSRSDIRNFLRENPHFKLEEIYIYAQCDSSNPSRSATSPLRALGLQGKIVVVRTMWREIRRAYEARGELRDLSCALLYHDPGASGRGLMKDVRESRERNLRNRPGIAGGQGKILQIFQEFLDQNPTNEAYCREGTDNAEGWVLPGTYAWRWGDPEPYWRR